MPGFIRRVGRETGGRALPEGGFGREWCRGTRGEASTSPRGAERGERMLLQRVGELPGLAAGEARKVWGGEENPVPRGKPMRGG